VSILFFAYSHEDSPAVSHDVVLRHGGLEEGDVVHAGGHLLQSLLAAAHVADATKRRLSISFMQRLEMSKSYCASTENNFPFMYSQKRFKLYIYIKKQN
jgi:hypothetical protein